MKKWKCQKTPRNTSAADLFRLRGRSRTCRDLLTAFMTVVICVSVRTTIADGTSFTFGVPRNLGTAVNSGNNDAWPCVFADDLHMLYSSDRPGGYGGYDLWMTTRPTRDDHWTTPVNLGPSVNSASGEVGASISRDGLELYFWEYHAGPFRPEGFGGSDIWVARRSSLSDDFGPPENVGSSINGGSMDANPSISADGCSLYFTSMRDGSADIWMSSRASRGSAWQPAVKVNRVNNTSAHDGWTAISCDGLVLVFGSNRSGFGDYDIWMSTRKDLLEEWSDPVNLGSVVNTASLDLPTSIGISQLYFSSSRPGGIGGVDIWQTSILPLVDFNGDGQVDAADMALLEANWGKSDSACDIGPFAWGDGVVDERDLAVLMESLMTPNPKAADVPCDVVLSWVSPSFADSHDVYLGTSFDEVNNVTRDDPCGVLVSEGQVETSYTPEGPLEFRRTYYWRVDIVDMVVGSLEPVIYKGPVLSFTVEPFAHPIQTIIATASSLQAGTSPQKTVDGSGLDENDGHSIEMKDMWQSATTPRPHWIQYQFDQVYTLHELWVWNSNQVIEPILGFGARKVKIEYSADGTAWTQLEGVPEFARAPGEVGYAHDTVVSFGGVQAKYVKLIIEANWGGVSPSTGLSEVRFLHIPERSWVTTP